LVPATIDSVLAQTFRDFEVIVVDDGSTDETPRVLKAYGDRIRIFRQENQGPEVARALGAAAARGDYVALLDSDDLLLPNALEIYDRIARQPPFPLLIIGLLSSFVEANGPKAASGDPATVEVSYSRDYLSKRAMVGLSNSNVVVDRVFLAGSGGFRLSSPATFHADEHHLILHLGECGPCAVIKRPATVAYRVHAGNSIRAVDAMIEGVRCLLQAEHSGTYPGGRARRFERYALIGGMAWSWIKHGWRSRLRRDAVSLLISAAPMVAAGVARKLIFAVRRRLSKSPDSVIYPPTRSIE